MERERVPYEVTLDVREFFFFHFNSIQLRVERTAGLSLFLCECVCVFGIRAKGLNVCFILELVVVADVVVAVTVAVVARTLWITYT